MHADLLFFSPIFLSTAKARDTATPSCHQHLRPILSRLSVGSRTPCQIAYHHDLFLPVPICNLIIISFLRYCYQHGRSTEFELEATFLEHAFTAEGGDLVSTWSRVLVLQEC